MPPKNKGGEGVKPKVPKPPWMTDEMFELSQNLQLLQGFYVGDAKDAKGGGGKGGDKKPLPTISRAEAGLFILQHIFPNNKVAKDKREECVKLGIVETSVKIIASQKASDMVPAAHILAVMCESFDQSRQIAMDSKPPVIPQLLTSLATQDSAPLRAAICGLLRVLSKYEDSRLRLWRQLKDWDWVHLVDCLRLQDLSQLGGRNAAHDAMAVLDSMCSSPEGDNGNIACANVVNAGGVQAIVSVLKDRVSHPMARAAGASILDQIMRRATSAMCEEVMIGAGALEPVIAVLRAPIVPLQQKACAAAVLLRFIMPDSLWKGAAAMNSGRPGTAQGDGGAIDGSAASKLEAMKLDATTLTLIGQDATIASRRSAAGALDASRPGTATYQDPAGPDDNLLDEEIKAQIAQRTRIVTQAGALKPLLELCVGPGGPLPDLEAGGAPQPEPDAGGGKKKKGKGKKGKGKLEPGMAECQTWASAVIRMASLDADQRADIAAMGAVRYLLPLLESRIHPARWHARQALINLSMSPALLPHLQLYKVPDYIHGANIPTRHYERPFPAATIVDESLQRIPAHLASAVAAAQRDIQSRGAAPTGGPTVVAGGSTGNTNKGTLKASTTRTRNATAVGMEPPPAAVPAGVTATAQG